MDTASVKISHELKDDEVDIIVDCRIFSDVDYNNLKASYIPVQLSKEKYEVRKSTTGERTLIIKNYIKEHPNRSTKKLFFAKKLLNVTERTIGKSIKMLMDVRLIVSEP